MAGCEFTLVPCPKECKDDRNKITCIQRKDAKRHLEECAYTVVPCKYQRLGCDVKVARKDMPAHEDEDKLHLHMALDKIVSIEEEIATIKNGIKEDKIKTLRIGDSLTFEFKIKADNTQRLCSEMFQSSPNGHNIICKCKYTLMDMVMLIQVICQSLYVY